jgi:hypothetical protein
MSGAHTKLNYIQIEYRASRFFVFGCNCRMLLCQKIQSFSMGISVDCCSNSAYGQIYRIAEAGVRTLKVGVGCSKIEKKDPKK